MRSQILTSDLKSAAGSHRSFIQISSLKKARKACILILFFLLALFAYGQEQKTLLLKDTSVSKSGRLNPEYLLKIPSFSLPLSLRTISDITPHYLNQSPVLSLQFSSWKLQQNLNLSPNSKHELAKQEEYKTLRTILGSIEAGGVAYLTYLHFKKYGVK
jgi:hypothetical protein